MDNYMKLEIAAISANESFARSAVAAFALVIGYIIRRNQRQMVLEYQLD